MIPVRYIGHRARYREGMYGSGIEFERGQTVAVPDELARRLLCHPDVYAHGEASEATAFSVVAETEDDAADETNSIYDGIACMDKAALEAFAKTYFSVTLNRRQRVESLRQQVAGLVDRFGLS